MATTVTGLEPFEIAASSEALDDLSRRLRTARLSDDEADTWDAGMNPQYLRELVAYWRDRFDWRVQERLLNRFRHFRVEVDGTWLHLIHEQGRGPHPLPPVLTHGFPDSFFRFTS
jgi:hypothetical protein